MTREELEHIIRASSDITDQYELVIVGSQSILGAIPNPEKVFTMSAEADVYPLHAPELADKIEGAIGEGLLFHERYGYYAQAVGPETATLPEGWRTRLHRVQNANTNAWAGRDKDRIFCAALVEHGYVHTENALALVAHMPLDAQQQRSLRARIRRWSKGASQPTTS